jgi:hypothetical protein
VRDIYCARTESRRCPVEAEQDSRLETRKSKIGHPTRRSTPTRVTGARTMAGAVLIEIASVISQLASRPVKCTPLLRCNGNYLFITITRSRGRGLSVVETSKSLRGSRSIVTTLLLLAPSYPAPLSLSRLS